MNDPAVSIDAIGLLGLKVQALDELGHQWVLCLDHVNVPRPKDSAVARVSLSVWLLLGLTILAEVILVGLQRSGVVRN